jgi:hypothetical protein
MFNDFPDDETGDALRRLQADGDNLALARDLDFAIVFADEGSASKFAEHFAKPGNKVSVSSSNCVEDFPWEVLVVTNMAPSHLGITQFEERLQTVANGLGGRNDGWGCFTRKRFNETRSVVECPSRIP